MKTAICCIAKCENNYLKEWADYHFSLGFSHIFIYDNNNVDGERIEPVFDGYDNITIVDCRGKKAFQNKAYTSFYKQYGHHFDWIAFIDVDEFVTFSERSGIQSVDEFLGRFDRTVDIIHLNWMCYGDSGIVDFDSCNVLERFTYPLEYDKKVKFGFPENNHVKSIYRGGLNVDEMNIGPHTCELGSFRYVDATGKSCDSSCFNEYDFSVAYIRHYVTKTIVEWVLKKSRGRVAVYSSSDYYSFDRFFLYNDRTKEKERIIKYYFLFRDAVANADATDLALTKSKLEYTEKQLEHISRDYHVVVNSKAYRIGKKIIKPLLFLKSFNKKRNN